MIQKWLNFVARIRQINRRVGLGAKLTVLLLPLVMLPTLIAVGLTYQRSRAILRQQAIDQLSSAAQAQITVLNDWTEQREQRLHIGSMRSALLDPLAALLDVDDVQRASSSARRAAREELATLKLQQGQVIFVHVLVARLADGMILASSQETWEGQNLASVPEGLLPSDRLASTPLFDDPLISSGTLAIASTAPLRVGAGEASDALLIGINVDLRIGDLMQEMQVFWEQRGVYRVERGQTYMVYEPDVLLRLERYGTAPMIEPGIQHPVFASAQANTSGIVEFTSRVDNTPVLAAYEWLPDWNLGVVVELPSADIFAGINALAPFIALLAIVTLALIVVAVPLVTGRAVRPLVTLSALAERIARGEWMHRVPVSSEDEIGRLALSFNSMIDELEESYRSLEERVLERTRQIQTASEVARDAVALREVEVLLNEVVTLISSRFNYYHAGVFLVDATGEYAVLRASSSEGGKRMLEKGHSLPVGKVGIVGYVTGSGNPRIALDVGADAYHFVNPDLPETRSEIALPLRSGDEIIGALDVQSTEPSAFGEEDLLVLQTMADQLAVAIENARLLEDQAILASRRRKVIDIYNQLATRLGYSQLIDEIPEIIRSGLDYTGVTVAMVEGSDVVIRSSSVMREELRPHLGESMPIGRGMYGRAVSMKAPLVMVDTTRAEAAIPATAQTSSPTTLIVPLLARGEAIGALGVIPDQPSHPQERDLEILELLAGQVAIALENARLFEEMQQSLQHVDVLLQQQTAETWEELLDLLAARDEESVIEYSGGYTPVRLPEDAPEMNVDISLRGETIGNLNLLRKSQEDWSSDDQAILMAVAEEVAGALEQARLLEELQRRATQLQAAAEIARDATGLVDLETLFQRAVNLIRERFGLYHVSIFLIDESGEQAVIRESTGEAGRKLKQEAHSLAVGSNSIIGLVTQSGECYVAHDVSIDPYYQGNPLLPDTRTELGVPLKIGDQVIGTLDIQHTHVHAFSEDDISIFEILADQLAVAVQNARNFEEALNRANREQAVMEITGKIRASGDIESMLRTAAREIRQVLGARSARVMLAEEPLDLRISRDDGSDSSPDNGHEIDASDPYSETSEG